MSTNSGNSWRRAALKFTIIATILCLMYLGIVGSIERLRDESQRRKRVITARWLFDALAVNDGKNSRENARAEIRRLVATGDAADCATCRRDSAEPDAVGDSREASDLKREKIHAVYDFVDRSVVILRTDGVDIRVVRKFPIPDPDRYHVRFENSQILNDASRAAAMSAGRRAHLSDYATILDRNKLLRIDDSLLTPSDLLRAWGGERLLISQPSTDIVRLHFRGKKSSADEYSVELRVPEYLRCEISENTDGAARVIFRLQSPCEHADVVRYGDYLKQYVNRGARGTDGVSVPARDSVDYARVIPYMRWLCKSRHDQQPTIVTT